MTNDEKLMQQALDALDGHSVYKVEAAIEALRARLAQPDPEQTRSEKMREAGYTKRDTRLECDECGKKFTRQMLPVHDCQPEPEQQLEWDEVFDYATAAYCRSSASKETLRLCFQHRNPQQEQVAIPWTANELMDFAKGIASIYNTPPVRQADSEPVAWMLTGGSDVYLASDYSPDKESESDWTALYTAPPQREWVGLTDEELLNVMQSAKDFQGRIAMTWVNHNNETYVTDVGSRLARAIEARLKEKNT